MANLGTLSAHIGMETAALRADAARAERTLNRFANRATSRLGAITKSVGGLSGAFAALGVTAGFAGVTAGVVGLAKSMVNVNAEMERYTTQFKVLHGSIEAAQARLEDLVYFAAKTPFELPQVIQASKILKAFGIDTNEMLRLIGDAAAGAGRPIEELAMWFGRLASGQTGEAIMRLTEMAVTSRKELAEMGVEFSKSGQVMSSTADLMAAVTDRVQQKFGGMMEEQSKTMEGIVSNIQDSWWKIRLIVGKPLFEKVKERLSTFLVKLDELTVSGKLEQWADAAGRAFDGLAVAAQNAAKRLAVLYEIAVALKDPLSFYPQNLKEAETWFGKIQDRLAWFIDKMPQFYLLRKIIQPFREGGIKEDWNWFLGVLEDINVRMGLMEKRKIPSPPSFVGPMPVVGPMPSIEPIAEGAAHASKAVGELTDNVNNLKAAGQGLGDIPMPNVEDYLSETTAMVEEAKRIDANRYAWLYQQEEISAAEYLAFLQNKLSYLQEYSDEWIAIQEKIRAIEASQSAERMTQLESERRAREQWIDAILAGYDTFWGTILDMDMTGAERRRAMFESSAQAILNIIAEAAKKEIKIALGVQAVKEGARKSELAVMASTAARAIAWLAKEGAAAVVAAAKWIYNAAAKIFEAHAWIPFAGVAIAGAMVGAMLATMKGLKSFGVGGFVKELGVVEPGEYVLRERAVRSVGVPALERLNRGAGLGGELTIHVDMGGFSFSGMNKGDALLTQEFTRSTVVDAVKEAIRTGELEI